MVNVCLEIETTRDIARQILRHRSFSFQEFSQRYANPTEDLNLLQEKQGYKIIKTDKILLKQMIQIYKKNGMTNNRKL